MVLDYIPFVPSIIDAKCVLISFSVTSFMFGVVAIKVWDTGFPVWAFVLSLLIGTFAFPFRCGLLLEPNIYCYSFRVYCSFWCDPGYFKPAASA